MATKKISSINSNQAPAAGQGAISQVMNACRVLPTESVADHTSGLMALLIELEANSPLKVYLAENVHECMLWIRRYRNQKHQAILKVTAHFLHQRLSGTKVSINQLTDFSDSDNIFQALSLNPAGATVKGILANAKTTLASVQAEAITWRSAELSALDENIAKQFRMLQVLQAEYERLENRKLKREYLQLQVENLRRNVNAIEAPQP